ncbi:MAG: Do family serine endopeptidase [Alphaproteobacteria bacterium]|nr:Do family serine endopeptidase [Alphaproteobacteria bacterium]
MSPDFKELGLKALALSCLTLALCLPAAPSGAFGPASVSELASQLSPAVVNIGTSRSVGDLGEPFPDLPEGSPLDELFRDRNPNSDGDGDGALGEARSLGSGFVVDQTGLIVTNNHVIDGADEILVFTTSGTRYRARVVGTDEKTDLAVLSITPSAPLPFVSFGDSDTAEIGDWVMAIGNPFGLGGSVSLGIVSARNRNINTGPYDNFIQTDAAINQGNSGGPLFDMDGKVVGINTAIISRTGGALGIGFAVPANLAAPIVRQLVEYGEARRGWLGVGIQEVTQDIAINLGLSGPEGAMIVEVTEGGPSLGVLKVGDIVRVFDGRPVAEMHDLPRLVSLTEIGKTVDLVVLRDGVDMTLAVTLGQLDEGRIDIGTAAPEPVPPADEAESVDPPGLEDLVGFKADTLTEQLRDEYGVDGDPEAAVIISSVRPGSDAEDKGISPGLLIAEVNQRRVDTVEDVIHLVDLAREEGRPSVLFKLTNVDGDVRFVAVHLG